MNENEALRIAEYIFKQTAGIRNFLRLFPDTCMYCSSNTVVLNHYVIHAIFRQATPKPI
jgi:uncharacterized membrane protein YhdT